MAFEKPKITYSGKINEVVIGKSAPIKVGGETAYPFHLFEGQMPHPPKIAMEVWDMKPDDWSESAMAPFTDVLDDPAAWAKKCVDKFGAEAIVVQLKSTDSNGLDKGPEEASAVVKKVLKAVKVPVIVWGSSNEKKDTDVLRKISEDCQGENLTLGPVAEGNHKQIGASALGYNHTLIASTPIDVNLAKQLNILLENLGVSKEKIIIDPTTGGLGYGLEYSYSVMERIRMAALAQEDEKLQYPMINNVGNEVWKAKEAKLTTEEAPTLGDAVKRGVLMESVGAVAYLLAGSDILILRHPETVRLVKKLKDQLITGDLDLSPAELAGKLAALNVKPQGEYPEIVKTAVAAAEPAKEEKKAAPAKAKEAAPKAAPKAAPAAAPKAEPAAPKAAPKVEEPAKISAEEEAKLKAEAEAKAKAEAEARAKAEAEAKAKAEAEAKTRAEAEAKAKVEAEQKAKDEAKAKARAEEEALIAARAAERIKRETEKEVCVTGPKEMKVGETQLSPVDKLLAQINRVNRRT
ncbi:MAG: acetyl-CoA decarbonylase/synthase complex subunit delta [Deltaproteobacteria bacterium]|nr:acetyl-CoA decarbonylase/synthase complex subunit delta [Deltaproteobacteria bacterium]